MRETRPSGSEGGARFNPLSLPLSALEVNRPPARGRQAAGRRNRRRARDSAKRRREIPHEWGLSCAERPSDLECHYHGHEPVIRVAARPLS